MALANPQTFDNWLRGGLPAVNLGKVSTATEDTWDRTQLYPALVIPVVAGAAPPAAVTPGAARGQWPIAPLRTTQRVPLTRIEHTVQIGSGGIAASDLTYDNAAQFYGDGTQTSTIKPPYGAWPVAPLRTTQRLAFAWQPHNSGTGVAQDDLLIVPPGQTYQFFGIPDVIAQQPLDPSPTALQANAALVETAAQVVSPSGADPLQANAALVETGAQVVDPAVPLQANAVLAQTAAQVVNPSAPLIANAALSETAAQVVEPTAPLIANAVLSETAAQVVNPSAPLQANALLVVTGSIILGPAAPAAAAAPHGQWPLAPLRSTQRVPLTRVEHNTDVGIAASDLTYQGNCEQFYGDGTQVMPLKPAFGQAFAPLRTTQRPTFTWQAHDMPTAANDLLTAPPGQTYQFFGIPDWAGVIPAQGTTLQANAVLSQASVQVVEPVAPVVANAVLSETVAQVVEPTAPLQATAALVETAAQVVNPSAPLQANAALSETLAAILAPAILQANSVLSLPVAQVVALAAILQANALLVVTGGSVGGPGATIWPHGTTANRVGELVATTAAHATLAGSGGTVDRAGELVGTTAPEGG